MGQAPVCVVIPMFNAQDYLAEAIASVQLQTFRDWSLIVLDDGSTDHSLAIAQALAASDHRISVVEDGYNRGLVSRLNQMTELTEAPLIARMDADDIMHPSRLATQVAFLNDHPQVHVVGASAYAIDQSSLPYGFKAAPRIPSSQAGFLLGSPLIHPSVTYRHAWLLTHPYAPTFERAEDYELWWRAQPDTTFVNLSEPLLYYRERGLPYRGKYRRSSQARRRLLKQNRRQTSWTQTASQLATSYLKDWLYDVAAWTGQEDMLIERRSRPLTAAEYLDAQLALTPILRLARQVEGGTK